MVRATLETLIVDNGGNTVKIGTVSSSDVRLVPNCIYKSKNERKRIFVGDEIGECSDHSGLFFLLPLERGYPVNWDVQQKVWERCFHTLESAAPSTRIVLSDQNYLIPALKDESNELLFEVFDFHSVYKSSALSFTASPHQVALVVDCGYSCTTIAAFYEGRPIQKSIVRIDIGGKVLTNQLKEWISYRELNVMEETYVVNECKEDICYVSSDIFRDFELSRMKGTANSIRREYVLPDFISNMRGTVRTPLPVPDEAQKITLNHERFMLPEALFRPSDIGINQMGIAEAAAECISRCPVNLRAALCNNIIITGGSSKFPGFQKRFIQELSMLMDDVWGVHLLDVDDPIIHAWNCAREETANARWDSEFVTRAQWQEYGDSVDHESFIDFV